MRRLRSRSTSESTSRGRSATSASHFMISATGALRSIASSRLITATPNTLSTRRVSSLGIVVPHLRVQVQRRNFGPARLARGLEILRVHEVHALVQVELELAAGVARGEPALWCWGERVP